MTTLWIVLALSLVLWWLSRLVATVRRDGYGVRPPPRSHIDHDDGLDRGSLQVRPFGLM